MEHIRNKIQAWWCQCGNLMVYDFKCHGGTRCDTLLEACNHKNTLIIRITSWHRLICVKQWWIILSSFQNLAAVAAVYQAKTLTEPDGANGCGTDLMRGSDNLCFNMSSNNQTKVRWAWFCAATDCVMLRDWYFNVSSIEFLPNWGNAAHPQLSSDLRM